MAENVDALKKAFDGFNSGDQDAIAEVYEDDAKWEGPNNEDVPGGGTTEGKDKILEMLGGIQEDWDEFQATPDEFIDAGDTVIVLGHVTAKHKESGSDLKTPFVHVWRMSDGKAKRVQALVDTHEILEAMKGGDGGDDS
ncbi:MAG: nuclear transport factor 2 family protein [Gaiellaceae bacterium]